MPVGGGRARPSTCTPSTARWEDAAGPAGPGRASSRRAERSSRRGRRAGGQAPRRSEIRRAAGPEGARNTSGAHQVPPDGRPPRGLQGLVPLVRKAPGTPAEHTKYRPIGGCRNPAGLKGAGGQGCGARGWRQGLAGLRDDAPSEARGADGERAGRRPRAHKAARRANCLYSPPTPGSGRPVKLTKRAMSPWKRAVTVAVAPARCLATMMSASPGRSSLS